MTDPNPATGRGRAPAPWRTALITGASAGIGREMARQLAAQGTHIVAVARDKARLEDLAREVAEAGHGVEVEVLPADLTDPAQLAAVESRLAETGESGGRPIDLLVNNAGFGTYGSFVELDRDGEEREIRLNVVAVVRLTHAALGPMIARGRGTVINVSSVAGLQSRPGNATYGATKAFVSLFSEAIHAELAGTGVTLTVVHPGFTHTEFQQRAGIEGRRIPGPLWQTAEECVRETLAAARAGKPWVVTGWPNKAVAAAIPLAPRGLRRRVAALVSSRL
ncbi:MAG TPA: SDR family oxidoreductase [Acidimicrobiales bacterium]